MSCLADRRDEHAVGAEAGGAVEPGGGGGVESPNSQEFLSNLVGGS